MEKELKPCPFCGSKAEMFVNKKVPLPRKRRFESWEDADKMLERFHQIGTVLFSSIRPKPIFTNGRRSPEIKWELLVELVEYTPFCTNFGCVGRNQTVFFTEAEAIEAWNRRANDG